MKITINEPCHENWNKMPPNDQGAFCLSCQKNVIDFSSKSTGDIKRFFTELPASHNVCGRFKENQLQEMNFEHFMNEFMSWKMLKRAAVIVYLVMSATLFGSCAEKEKEAIPGETDVFRTVKTRQDTVCETPAMPGEPALVKDPMENNRKGKVKITPKIEQHTMGAPLAEPDSALQEPVKEPPVIKMGEPEIH